MRERKIGPIVGYVALKFIAPQSQAPWVMNVFTPIGECLVLNFGVDLDTVSCFQEISLGYYVWSKEGNEFTSSRSCVITVALDHPLCGVNANHRVIWCGSTHSRASMHVVRQKKRLKTFV
jgi:hypothetical protein